jgi:hypothetical protein
MKDIEVDSPYSNKGSREMFIISLITYNKLFAAADSAHTQSYSSPLKGRLSMFPGSCSYGGKIACRAP